MKSNHWPERKTALELMGHSGFIAIGVQLVHNFGTAAVAGLPIAALWFKPAPPILRKMAWFTLLACLLQASSGAGFGTVSYFMEGEPPEIHHLARAALYVKIGCAALAIAFLASHFVRRTAAPGNRLWAGLAVLLSGRAIQEKPSAATLASTLGLLPMMPDL